MKFIAHRFWSKTIPVFYVSEMKGEVGDWGYTTDVEKALKMSKKQVARFSSYCQKLGITPAFIRV
jgi:hypothetical protein